MSQEEKMELGTYELALIVKQQEYEELIASIDKDLNVNGGEILTVLSKEPRNLEYKLNGYDEGIFVRIEFISDPQNIKVINRTMTLSEASLWHKIIRKGGLAFGCKSSYQCY